MPYWTTMEDTEVTTGDVSLSELTETTGEVDTFIVDCLWHSLLLGWRSDTGPSRGWEVIDHRHQSIDQRLGRDQRWEHADHPSLCDPGVINLDLVDKYLTRECLKIIISPPRESILLGRKEFPLLEWPGERHCLPSFLSTRSWFLSYLPGVREGMSGFCWLLLLSENSLKASPLLESLLTSWPLRPIVLSVWWLSLRPSSTRSRMKRRDSVGPAV